MKMKSLKIIITYFLIFTPIIASAQSTVKLHGTVSDAHTKQPVYGANVLIEGTGYGSASNRQGYFEIENVMAGNYSIIISHVGYQNQRFRNVHVPKDHPVRLTVSLQPAAIPLPEVEVFAERYNEIERTAVWIIEEETIARSNVHNVGELIAQTPGIHVQDSGGMSGSKKISIRGSQSNQVLVLLDGVPLNDELGGDVDLSSIPANIIEKIEIHRGSSSHRFGSGSIGGVINIITKRTMENTLQVNSSFGAFGTKGIEPGYSGRYKNSGFLVAYHYVTSQGDFPYQYENSAGETIRENRMNADLLSRNLFGRISYFVGDHHFSAQAGRMMSARGIPGKINGWTPYARSSMQQDLYGIEYQVQKSALELSTNVRYSNSFTENTNRYPPDVDRRYKRYPQYDYSYRLRNVIANSEIKYTLSKWLQLIAGYRFRNISYKDKNNMQNLFTPAVQKAHDHAHSIFLHQDWIFEIPWNSLQLSIRPAIRYDEMNIESETGNRFEHQWSPACDLFLSTGDLGKIYVKSTVAKSFRLPTFADLFYQDVRIEGKPDLLPEQSDNFEAGIGFQLTEWGRFHGEATYFHYTIDNLIIWRLGSFEVFRPYNNDAEISGQEYLLTVITPEEKLSVELSYSHLNPLNKNTNETTFNKIIPYRPRSTFKGTVGIQLENVGMQIRFRNVGKRYVNEANTKSLDRYQVFDLNLIYSMNLASLDMDWKFSGYNIFAEEYETVRDMPLPGREWRIGLNLKIDY